MAITAGVSAGIASDSTSQSSWGGSLSVGSLAADDWIIIGLATDNVGTTDGDLQEHGFSGEGLTWTKCGEYTNGNGAAAAGCTISAWLARNTTGSTIGTFDFATTYQGAVVDKVISAWKFSAGPNLALVPGTSSGNATDGSNGFGAASISGLDNSVERLYFRALAKEVNSTAQITQSDSFTPITANRSRNNADAIIVRGEFIIVTAAGAFSNPVLAVSGDTAGVFFALAESGSGGGTANTLAGKFGKLLEGKL